MLGWIRHLQFPIVVACVLVVSSAAHQPHLTHGHIKGFSTGEPEAATLLRPAHQAMVATLRSVLLRRGVGNRHRHSKRSRILVSGYNSTFCTGRKLLQSEQAINCNAPIQMGDTLDILGTMCGADLAALNHNITNVDNIRAGDCICVPSTCTAVTGIHKHRLAVCCKLTLVRSIFVHMWWVDAISTSMKGLCLLSLQRGAWCKSPTSALLLSRKAFNSSMYSTGASIASTTPSPTPTGTLIRQCR